MSIPTIADFNTELLNRLKSIEQMQIEIKEDLARCLCAHEASTAQKASATGRAKPKGDKAEADNKLETKITNIRNAFIKCYTEHEEHRKAMLLGINKDILAIAAEIGSANKAALEKKAEGPLRDKALAGLIWNEHFKENENDKACIRAYITAVDFENKNPNEVIEQVAAAVKGSESSGPKRKPRTTKTATATAPADKKKKEPAATKAKKPTTKAPAAPTKKAGATKPAAAAKTTKKATPAKDKKEKKYEPIVEEEEIDEPEETKAEEETEVEEPEAEPEEADEPEAEEAEEEDADSNED